MSIFQVLVVSFIAGFEAYDTYGLQCWTFNYMLYSTVTGLFLGDPLTGLLIGSVVQLMSLGVAGLGGASVPNYGMTAIIATAITVTTGQDYSIGLALGLVAGTLYVQLDVIMKILNGFVVRESQKLFNQKKFSASQNILWLGAVMTFLMSAVPTFIVCAIGETATNFIINAMPAWFTGGLNIASAMLPVIGMGMLLTYMPSKKYFSFVLIGFVMSGFLGLGVLPCALIGGAIAYEYYKRLVAAGDTATAVVGGMDEDE